jgi:hypothetical protein
MWPGAQLPHTGSFIPVRRSKLEHGSALDTPMPGVCGKVAGACRKRKKEVAVSTPHFPFVIGCAATPTVASYKA